MDNKTGDTTFWIPGAIEDDALDNFVFSVTVDLQTASDLYEAFLRADSPWPESES